MTSVWNSDQIKLGLADATPYYRHAIGPLASRPKKASAGCSPPASSP